MKNIVVCLLLVASSTSVQAQGHCDESDTFDSCAARLNTPSGAVEQQGKDSMLAAVAAKNTGDASTSTFNDFLPLLRALIETGGMGSDDGKLGIEWSNPLGLPRQEQNKLTVQLVKSQLHEPLKAALRTAALDSRIGALEDGIDEGDDVVVGFSYARASKTFGRDPSLHDDLVSELLRAAVKDDDIVNDAPRKEFERQVLVDADQQGRTVELDKAFKDNGMTPAERTRYIGLVEESVLRHHSSTRALSLRLQQLGLYRFLDLVNNQPQWSVTANYRSRDELVGPDELNATLAYERGWANVNAYREHRAARCSAESEVNCLGSYLAQTAGIDPSLRMIFKAEYTKLQRLDLALPGSSFAFAAKAAERFGISAGIGRYIGGERTAGTRTRVDAKLGYEDFSDDPARQDRGLASVTLTLPVSEGLFISLGAVYATKPEFRGEVDEEISARAGIVYKLLQQ